jgi:DNA repair protein SbcD/Mre11
MIRGKIRGEKNMGVAFRFVHTADLHLDSPFIGIGQTSPVIQEKLREATFEAFHRIVDLCIRENVDFLTIGGDVFDGANRSLRAQVRFRDELKRLAEAGIRSFVIHGNHDHQGGEWIQLEWPESVHIFSSQSVEAVPVIREGREIARIYGISYSQAEVTENLAKRFKRDADAPYAIALLHSNVGSANEHANYAPCTLSELKQSGFDFWGLGHIHKRALLHEEHPVILYPGNPQGRHPNETGARGCYLVEVGEDGHTVCTFHETDAVRWTLEEITIDGLTREEELYARLLELLDTVYRQHRGRTVIVRILLKGRGPLHAFVKVREMREDLLAALRENAPVDEETYIFCESIHCQTKPLIDKEIYRNDPGLLGDVLALAEACRTEEGRLDFLRRAIHPLFEVASARQVLEQPSDEELLQWLAEAEDVLLELLGKEED